MKKGFFLTLEGGDGAGKTTLLRSLASFLEEKGKHPLVTREPGGTPLGEKIRELLLTPTKEPLSPFTELSLFLAARAEHIDKVLLPALQQGRYVLCDRFNDSSIAYQGFARNLGYDTVQTLCATISQGLSPNLTFYLDLNPSIGQERRNPTRVHDRIEQEGLPFQEKLRQGYLFLAEQEPSRIQILDASQTPEKVFAEAKKHLEEKGRIF